MNAFKERNGELFINGLRVLHGWESFEGWYWFATEKVQEQTSRLNGRYVKDTIWFGLVQGIVEEWGSFSQAELEALYPRVWKIPQRSLAWSGRRGQATKICEEVKG